MESHHPQQKQKIDENCMLDSATMAKMKDISICSGFPKYPFMIIYGGFTEREPF